MFREKYNAYLLVITVNLKILTQLIWKLHIPLVFWGPHINMCKLESYFVITKQNITQATNVQVVKLVMLLQQRNVKAIIGWLLHNSKKNIMLLIHRYIFGFFGLGVHV